MNTLLALDFGTQGAKVLLLGETGETRASVSSSYPFTRNEGGWMQQSPLDWRRALGKICRCLSDEDAEGFRTICGICVTGQMHGVVLLDDDGQPLDDAMVWCDTRCAEEARALENTWPDDLKTRLRNPLVTAYTAPKLLWIKHHQNELLQRAASVLFCKDYIRFLLTGEQGTDYSDASGSLLFDFERGGWSEEAMDRLGIVPSLLPEIFPSAQIAGHVTHMAAAEFGLVEGIPVAVGAGDLACGLLGSGLSDGSQALINLGTAGQVLTLTPGTTPPADGGYLFKFLDDTGGMMLFALPSAAYCLRWFLEKVAPDIGQPDQTGFERLSRWADACPAGARGLLFAPYLTGTGSPYFDDGARAAFLGLDAGHSRNEMARAVFEGVAFGIRDCMEYTEGVERPAEVFFSGGASKSKLWRQIVADVLGRTIGCLNVQEATSRGAGSLAAQAVGMRQAFSLPAIETQQPNQRNTQLYEDCYQRFRRIYPALKQVFKGL